MSKTAYQNKVINRIRQLRIDNDISQIGMANIIEVSNGQIGNIESPKFPHKYTLKQLYLISQHFRVTLDYLLTGNDITLDTEHIVKALIQYDE